MAFKPTITLLFFILCLKAGAQQFQATYGGLNDDAARDICLSSDGGYVVLGTTNSFGAGLNDIYLIKTNSIGGNLWTKTYGGTNVDGGSSIVKTNDGGYIISASTNSFGSGNYDFFILKIDSVGTIQWSKTYGQGSNDYANHIQQTLDGGYIIGGRTDFGGNDDVLVIKTDSLGNVLWCYTYPVDVANQDGLSTIKQTTDNGYIINGFTVVGMYPCILNIKIDSAGTLQWYKTYGASTTNVAFAQNIEITNDGGYISSGTCNYSSTSFSGTPFLLKTDSLGTVIWSKAYSGLSGGSSVEILSDGGYLLTGRKGYTTPTITACIFLMKVDSSGIFQWNNTFGGVAEEQAISVKKCNSDGYIIAGHTKSFGATNYDIYIIKTDSSGNGGCDIGSVGASTLSPAPIEQTSPSIVSNTFLALTTSPLTISNLGGTQNMLCYVGIDAEIFKELQSKIYPNPTTGLFKFSTIDNNSTIKIYDCMGKLVLQTNIKDSEQSIDISNEEKGIYFYRIENKKGEFSSGKIVLE